MIIINPEFDIDDNDLTLVDGEKYANRVVYSVTFKDGVDTGDALTIDSDVGSTVDGLVVLATAPFSLILTLDAVTGTARPSSGDITSMDIQVTAYDAEGNSAVSSTFNKPL